MQVDCDRDCCPSYLSARESSQQWCDPLYRNLTSYKASALLMTPMLFMLLVSKMATNNSLGRLKFVMFFKIISWYGIKFEMSAANSVGVLSTLKVTAKLRTHWKPVLLKSSRSNPSTLVSGLLQTMAWITHTRMEYKPCQSEEDDHPKTPASRLMLVLQRTRAWIPRW